MKRTLLLICIALIWCCNGLCQSLQTNTVVNNTLLDSIVENTKDVETKGAGTKTAKMLDSQATGNNAKADNDNNKVSNNIALTIILPIVLSLLALLTPIFITGIQQQIRLSQEFQSCSKSLYSDNPIEQASAAILLRGYLKKRRVGLFFSVDYSREAKNLIVALLRTSIPTVLQKNLADGLSYANSLEGQDLQHVNMIGALIKPKSRIKYEITKEEKYKRQRLSMKNADMFHAVIQESSINNVDATEAVFLYAILCGTSFRNCILKNARFQNSNVSNVRFDKDCQLEGANFKDAIGIESAIVKSKEGKDYKDVNLMEFLDSEGVFCTEKPEEAKRYKPTINNLTIFVSKLGIMDAQQKMRYDSLMSTLREMGNIEMEIGGEKKLIGKIESEIIERGEYPTVSQLVDVSNHMTRCDGCVVFAFEYLNVSSGFIHKEVEGDDKKTVKNKVFTSPWLHIETALANEKHMPCLVVYDKNLWRDGMFDATIVGEDNANNKLWAIEYADDIDTNNKVLQMWISNANEYRTSKKK